MFKVYFFVNYENCRLNVVRVIQFAAAVNRKPGEPLVIEEIIVAPPMPHEARIRIICTSLCYSDITFWRMKVNCFTFHSLFASTGQRVFFVQSFYFYDLTHICCFVFKGISWSFS